MKQYHVVNPFNSPLRGSADRMTFQLFYQQKAYWRRTGFFPLGRKDVYLYSFYSAPFPMEQGSGKLFFAVVCSMADGRGQTSLSHAVVLQNRIPSLSHVGSFVKNSEFPVGDTLKIYEKDYKEWLLNTIGYPSDLGFITIPVD